MLAKKMHYGLAVWLFLATGLMRGAESAEDLLAGQPGRARPNPVLVMVDGRENEIFTRSQTFVNGMDIISFSLAHAGGEEFLWQVLFYNAPDFAEGVFNFYIDCDLRVDTGLKIDNPVEEPVAPSAAAVRANGFDPPQALAGADLGVVFSRGRCQLLRWSPDGTAAAPEERPFLIKDKCLYFRMAIPAKAANNKVSFAIAANTHSLLTSERPRPPMRDTTRRAVIHRFPLDPAMDDEAVNADHDRDGLPDAIEKSLGTDLARADQMTFQMTHELMPEQRRAQPGYDPGLDLTGYAAGHVAEDRFLFRLDFAAPPAGNGMYLIYLNTDNQAETGRRLAAGTPTDGTDVAIACAVNGRQSGKSPLTLYGLTAEQCGDGHAAFATVGNSLYFTVDLPIAFVDGKATFGMSVLVHTLGTAEVRMLDRSDPVLASGLTWRDGKKPVGGGIWNGQGEMLRAGGLPLIRPLLVDSANVVFPCDRLELAGLDIDYFTNRQYGHLRILRPLGSAGMTAPKGRYHVGFMIFDTSDGSRIGVRINDRDRSSRLINAGNSDYWLYWEKDAYDFQGDEYVELVALGGMAPHPICFLVFLSAPPAPVELDCTVSDLLYQVAPGGAGEVRLSWITANLAPTRLEYGVGDFSQVHAADKPMLVHRALLKNLSPEREYQARAVGRDLAGQPVYSETVRFRPQPPPPAPTVGGRRQVVLTVRNEQEFPGRGILLRSGIPFPRAQLGSLEYLRVLSAGREIPSQFAVLARWPDQSFKAVMVTFVGTVDAEATTEYVLEYGAEVRRADDGLAKLATYEARAGGATVTGPVRLDSGAAQFVVTPEGELLLADNRPVRTRVRPLQGPELATGALPAVVEIEENGPVYARVKSTVAFPMPRDADTPQLSVICRYEVWRGSPYVKLAHSFLVQGREQMSFFEDITLGIPWGASSWQASLADGSAMTLTPGERVFQRRSAEIIRNGGEPQSGRVIGNFLAGDRLVALRQCWEQYPKGVAVGDGELRLELCPDFEAGFYDSFPFNWKSTKVFFCLQDGHYRFRRGMRKTHELLLGQGTDNAAAAAFCQRPLLATAPPEWYCRSGVFYDIAPRDPEAFPTYEANADHSFAGFRHHRENRDDYGLLNFGDWFGERGVHWGNCEYDNAVGFLLQYIRSGQAEAFHLGDEAERHVRDVDVENWVPDQGQVGKLYQHQVGHHGGYYKESPKGEEAIIWGNSSVSHAWTEGHIWYYFLRGEADSLAAGLSIADYFLDREFSRYYNFQDLRTPGWHLILDLAAYGANYDPAYLNAAKVIMRRVYAYQDTMPRPLPEHQLEPGRRTAQVGGWSRMMVPGHCHCEPRHRGNAGFMLAVLLSGIKYYHAYTQDPRARQCLMDGAHYFLDEVYSEEHAGVRYTSCPRMPFSTGAAPLLMEGVARAYLWTRDPRLLHPLSQALPLSERPAHYGSGYTHRCSPRVLADLQAAGLRWDSGKPVPAGSPGPFVKPDWLKDGRAVVAQAENFIAQGDGECRVMADRFGAWGKVVTYWHASPGHWLEWEVDLPADGEYVLRFHYATQTTNTLRDILVDGALPHPRAEKYHFPATGGFGTRSTEWRLLSFADDANEEITLRLKQGRHTIRMVNRADGLAFDFLALVPAGLQ